jgi:hypothetical protein
MRTVTRLHGAASPVTVAEASRRFLRRDAFESTIRAIYGGTLAALTDAVGADTDVATVPRRSRRAETSRSRQVPNQRVRRRRPRRAGYTPTVQVHVRLLHERRYDPPRPVEVEHEGQWCPGFQSRWLLCDDNRG